MGNSYDVYNQPQEHAPANITAVAGLEMHPDQQTSYLAQSPRQRAHREAQRTQSAAGGGSSYDQPQTPDTDPRLIEFLNGIGHRLGDVRHRETDEVAA